MVVHAMAALKDVFQEWSISGGVSPLAMPYLPMIITKTGLVCVACRAVQEESFHLVDNRPVKTNKFGQGRSRFQQQQRYQQQRRDKEAKGQEEKKKGPAQAQKKTQWQPYGRDNQRVRRISD
jgi:hypothetical protein